MKLALLLSLTFSLSAQAEDLSAKLERQWSLYDSARQTLLQHVAQSGSASSRAISRADWDAMVTQPWSATELAELQASQTSRIAAAKRAAQRSSSLDLDQVRAGHAATAFCANLPKGGMLHIHPFGTLDRATAASLLAANVMIDSGGIADDIANSQGNSALSSDEMAFVKTIPPETRFLSLTPAAQSRFTSLLFLPAGKQSFPRFNAVFEFLGVAIDTMADYDTVLRSFVRKAVDEHVSYVEFTTGSNAAMLAELADLERSANITIRLNYAFQRTKTIDQIQAEWEGLKPQLEHRDPHLVGIDILDNEEGNSALEKGQILYGSVLADGRLHRTQHAGEIGDVRNPRDAMIMGAERLGHGVNLAKDPLALEYAAHLHEAVEVNLTSNLRLTDIATIATHPFLTYLRLGLPISLSTDDEGIFDTDIDHDCELAISQSDVTYAEMKQMAFNSIETSFASDADRSRLRAQLANEFLSFEASAFVVPYRRGAALN